MAEIRTTPELLAQVNQKVTDQMRQAVLEAQRVAARATVPLYRDNSPVGKSGEFRNSWQDSGTPTGAVVRNTCEHAPFVEAKEQIQKKLLPRVKALTADAIRETVRIRSASHG